MTETWTALHNAIGANKLGMPFEIVIFLYVKLAAALSVQKKSKIEISKNNNEKKQTGKKISNPLKWWQYFFSQ